MRRYQPTPAWVIIGLLTSFLILILQTTLYSRHVTRYAAFIVSLTYTSAILVACSLSLLGHLLVRRYPMLDRFLNVDIDIASVMTGTWGGKRDLRGRNRASVGGWIASTVVVQEGVEDVTRPDPVMAQRGRTASDTSSEEAEWRAESAHYVPPPR